MTLITDPVLEVPCPRCDKPMRITGGQVVSCCGVRVRVDLLIKTEPEDTWLERVFTIHAAIRHLEDAPSS